jgi:hypothetical protein
MAIEPEISKNGPLTSVVLWSPLDGIPLSCPARLPGLDDEDSQSGCFATMTATLTAVTLWLP